MTEKAVTTKDVLFQLFCCRPNLVFSTMKIFVRFFPLVPLKNMSELVVVDEVNMVLPSDLCIFTPTVQNNAADQLVNYLLVGDHCPLQPYSTLKVLLPLSVTPNLILLNHYDGLTTSRLTVTRRCHSDVTFLASNNFYGGFIRSGRSLTEKYIQQMLPPHLFPQECTKDYVSKTTQKSRSRRSSQIHSRLILLQHGSKMDLCTNTIYSSMRTFSGGIDLDSPAYNLIQDDSTILMSLPRSADFTVVFGARTFLCKIPCWNSILTS